MRILVIGATGATGTRLVEQALERGDEVVAYCRHPEKLPPRDGLRIVGGELWDETALTQVMEGVDAVLVAIGPASMRKVTVMQDTLPHVAAAMSIAGVRRLVVLSAFGVGESARRAALPLRVAYRTLLGSVYADKVAAEKVLATQGLATTLVLPVMLTNDADEQVEVRPLPRVGRLSRPAKVSRASVARVMLDAARDDTTIGAKLVVSSPGTLD